MKKGRVILAYLLMAGILFGNSMSVFATEKTQLSEETKKEDENGQIHIITGFQNLEIPYYEWQEKYPLQEAMEKLPQTLTVEIDGKKKEEIPVTWKCMDDYSATQLRVYEFLPYWDEEKYLLSNELDEYWDVPYVQISVPLAITENEQADIDVTRKALAALLERQTVQAVVYLCETYEVKQKPAKSDKTEVSLASGTTVVITDVAIDEYRNVWYQVKGEADGKNFTGYIEKKNLAYANEAFREWEEKYAMVFTGYNTLEDEAEIAVNADVEQFPESYQSKLMGLKKKHPNWIFVKQNIGLDWETVTRKEYSEGRSIIDAGMGDAYKEKYYGPGWYYACEQAVCYYMDPRNFLDDTSIFQFEQLTFNPSYHNRDAVEKIMEGTLMDDNLPDEEITYASALYKIGSAYDVSPFYLMSRICQVQDKKSSPLILGNYSGYEGYYNYFYIGISEEKLNEQTIKEGLSFAQNENWSSSYAALEGGTSYLAKEYILSGQDTLYLQKYNVAAKDGALYQHQYTQNISAPYKEAFRIKAAYAAAQAEDNIFVFKIPVYENMPEKVSPVPRKQPLVTATLSQEETEEAQTSEPTAKPVTEPTSEPTAKPVMEPTAKPDEGLVQKEEAEQSKEEPEQVAKEQIEQLLSQITAEKKVVLDTKESAVVYAQTLKMIKEQDIQMKIPAHDTVTWSVDGSKILSEPLFDIDFAVAVGESRIPDDKLKELTAGTTDYVELSLSHEGVFGFDAVFDIKLSKAKQGQYANLFYYNEQGRVLEFICAAPVNKEKMASFTFKHASDYVIIVNDMVMEKVVFKVTEEQLQKQQVQKQLELAEKRAEMLAAEMPAREPLKAAGIIVGILVLSIGIGLIIWQKYRKKSKKGKR